jgi:hypothetical protein
MPETYYLDESGNTGDLTLAGPGFTFDNQPTFVLACIGVDDLAALEAEFQRLRKKYKIQSQEMKFGSVQTKPAFMLDLIAFAAKHDLPIMIEVTDKRYAICIHIVQCLIVPPCGADDFGPTARVVKNTFADRLRRDAPNEVLEAFGVACQAGTKDTLASAFDLLLRWLEQLPPDEVVEGLLLFARDTFEDFENSQENDTYWKRLRPAPDTIRSGKLAWILPHVSSLLNIYGRINKAHAQNLDGVRLCHDEQMQFDRALVEGMKIAEGPIGKDLPRFSTADFQFLSKAYISFADSQKNAGVQLADLLAGMMGYCVKPFVTGVNSLPRQWIDVLKMIFSLTDESRARGVNFVVPTNSYVGLMDYVR